MSTLLAILFVPLFVTWAVGVGLAWPFWYFGGGFNKAKRHYGIDWRAWRWHYFAHSILWPYFVIRWFQRRGTGEKYQAVVFCDGREVRDYLSSAQYDIDDKCVAFTRTTPAAKLTESSACPFCGVDLARLNHNDTMNHFMTNHVDDQVRGDPSSGLALACGCPHVQWEYDNFRPGEIVPHLKRAHGFNQRAQATATIAASPPQPQRVAQPAPAAVSGQWRPDPSGRHQYRWHDGNLWTKRVADNGVESVD